MTDIKIELLGTTATTSGVVWVSENKTVMDYLNTISNRELIKNYVPDYALALLSLVQTAIHKVKVVSITNQPKYEKGVVY